MRASIMGALILLARTFNRMYLAMRGLVLAGAVMLVLNPYLLAFDTGFQLSFVATMGLILAAPHIEARLAVVPQSIGVREFLTATLATQLFVLPVLLYQIGEFSVVAVIVNVLVLPMVAVAMFLTFITGIIGFVSTTLAIPTAYMAYFSLAYIVAIAEWFAALPFAAYVVPPFPFWVVPVAYAGIGYVLWTLWHRDGSTESGDELPGWVIEEEATVRTRLAQARASSEKRTAAASHDAAADDTPIFFR